MILTRQLRTAGSEGLMIFGPFPEEMVYGEFIVSGTFGGDGGSILNRSTLFEAFAQDKPETIDERWSATPVSMNNLRTGAPLVHQVELSLWQSFGQLVDTNAGAGGLGALQHILPFDGRLTAGRYAKVLLDVAMGTTPDLVTVGVRWR